MAPPYEEIVLREGRDRAYFVKFLKEDHFPMTTFRLFDNEKADVVEYLMALRKAELKDK
jgi:cytochrome c1